MSGVPARMPETTRLATLELIRKAIEHVEPLTEENPDAPTCDVYDLLVSAEQILEVSSIECECGDPQPMHNGAAGIVCRRCAEREEAELSS